MMNSKKNEQPFQTELWEKWLESFFLDPFTTSLDQTHFQVDIFDSDTEVIIEALLPQHLLKEIVVSLDGEHIRIISCQSSKQMKERTITFPFEINAQKVESTYSNETLEITISKIQKVKPLNRNIPLS
jgi:HSP20 family molecular chaperone IbpA